MPKKYALQAEGNKVMLSDLRHLMPISSISTSSISKAAELASVFLWQNLLASFFATIGQQFARACKHAK